MSWQVNKEGTVAIRRKTSRPVTACAPPTDDEDPYGRLTNMKLTSFTEEQQMLQLQQQQQESLYAFLTKRGCYLTKKEVHTEHYAEEIN